MVELENVSLNRPGTDLAPCMVH